MIGTTLTDRYQLRKQLGSGGTGPSTALTIER